MSYTPEQLEKYGFTPSDGPIPNIPGLPPVPQTPQGWEKWRNEVLLHRVHTFWATSQAGEEGELARAREIELCRRSFAYMANVYGGIYEARREEMAAATGAEDDDVDDLAPVVIPFVMFPFQIEVSLELEDILHTNGPMGDAFFLKSRDMGLSNITAFWVAHHWLTRKRFQARVLSRKEDLVDRTGDPDSLFWKIETFLAGLPDWLFKAFAPSFDWRRHRMAMRFIHPDTKNVISGESTNQNAGRGGRATVIIYDEACFMPGLRAIWTAGRASTNHRVAISTASVDEGMDCHDLCEGEGGYEQPRVRKISWDLHPYHDAAWLEAQRMRDSETGVRREIFMDWFAGESEWVYPEARDYVTGWFPKVEGAETYVAIDDGFDDDWAMALIQVVDGRPRVLDCYTRSHMPIDFYGSILTNQPQDRFRQFYGDDEDRVMAWLPRTADGKADVNSVIFVADPHVKHVEQIAGTSVYEHLWKNWNIKLMFDMNQRTHKDLRTKTAALLPMTDFHEDAAPMLKALQNLRFKKQEGEMTSEQKTHMHSKWSHLASAFSYFAVNYDLFRIVKLSGSRVKYLGRRAS